MIFCTASSGWLPREKPSGLAAWDFFPDAFLWCQLTQRKASLIFSFCASPPAVTTAMPWALTWTWGGLKSMLYTLSLPGWTQRALRRSFNVSKGMFKLITRSSSQILSSASACPSVRGKPVQVPQQQGAVRRGRKVVVMEPKPPTPQPWSCTTTTTSCYSTSSVKDRDPPYGCNKK